MRKEFGLKRILKYNIVILAVFMLVISVGIICALYNVNDTHIKGQILSLSQSNVSAVNNKLSNISRFSTQVFLNEEFQEDLRGIKNPDASNYYDSILKRFSSMLIMPTLIADIYYWPFEQIGQINAENYIIQGPQALFMMENFEQFSAYAQNGDNHNGKLGVILGKNDDRYIAFTRVVTSVLPDNYLQPIGLGVVVVPKSQMFDCIKNTAVLGAKSCVIDGSDIAVFEGSMESSFDEHHIFIPDGKALSFPLRDFSWKIVSVYTVDTVMAAFDSVAVAFLIVAVVVTGLFFVCVIYLNYVNSKQYYLFIDTFKKIEAGMWDTQMPYGSDADINRVAKQFNSMIQSITDLQGQVTSAQIASLELELEKNEYLVKYLNSQINKHFMFNTFALARALLNIGKNKQAAECIDAISEVMRYTLATKGVVQLKDELQSLTAYLRIQRMRKPQINVHFDVQEDALTEEIPKFILQPIVENCYAHGFDDDVGNIDIRIQKQEEKLILCVEDDGKGVSQDELRMLRSDLDGETDRADAHGIALRNIARRLKIVLTAKSTLTLDSTEGKGFCVTMEIYRK